jgi:plastocyanin
VESDGAEAEADVAAGERATLTVPDLAAGTYRVICTYHPQMEAALRIGG